MKYLITGGCGFLGCNLAVDVLRRGEELHVFDNLSRAGSIENLQWLRTKGQFQYVHADIRSYHDVEKWVREIKPDVVFHLAGQVAMTTSIEDPRADFEINAIGSQNILEAVRRHVPAAIVVYSSTNKVYGNLDFVQYHETSTRYVAPDYEHGFCESIGLDFRSPYGCSKGAADQYMLDYARIFGLRTIVFRHSSIFGDRQFSTYDQGWIGWFVRKALETRRGICKDPFTISGTGKQVRDVLFSSDLIDCYFDATKHIEASQGKAFNIGGGMKNSLSLLELFDFLEREIDVKLSYSALPARQCDQKIFVADIRKAANSFHWSPKINKDAGLRKMVSWVQQYVG